MKYFEIKELARKFRKAPTLAEKKLWSILRLRKLAGKKFLRQHPFMYEDKGKKSFFIFDFYCAQERLAIELDGGVHDIQAKRDRERDLIVEETDIKVLRIRNEELDDMCRLKERIINALLQLKVDLEYKTLI